MISKKNLFTEEITRYYSILKFGFRSNSILQDRLEGEGLCPNYIPYFNIISNQCGTYVFPNSRPALLGLVHISDGG